MKRRVKIDQRNQVDVGGRLVELSGHAVRSYRERFKPTLGLSAARQDLEAKLTQAGAITERRPSWLSGYTNDASAYVVLEGGDLVLPLRLHSSKSEIFVAPTCLYRC